MRSLPMFFLMLAEEDMVNVTPNILKFLLKFLVVFGLIALMGFLTPNIAKKVDEIRAQTKQKHPDDPNCEQVRGIYDMPKENESEDEPSE